MSWEAYRWTAKSPSELYKTLGPQGVDHLVRQMLDACWRHAPEEGRTVAVVRRLAQEVFNRNMSVWAKIKSPSPTAFFENLLPYEADGFLRQGMVLCWMMMPRSGGRKVAQVRKIIGEIYQRNLRAWEEDEGTFTGKAVKRTAKAKSVRSNRTKGKGKAAAGGTRVSRR